MTRIPITLAALLTAAAALAAPGQPADPPGAPVQAAAGLDPAAIPLVEIVGPGDDGRSQLGIVIAPGQVVFAPGMASDATWTPGGHVRCIRSGAEASIERVLNWGSGHGIDWGMLEVKWPEGAGPTPLPLAAGDVAVGDQLRIVSWRAGEYTIFEGEAERTHCRTCAHHLSSQPRDDRVKKLRRGAPALNDRGELAGFLHERGWGVTLPSFRTGYSLGYIPAGRWTVESVEPVTEARFAEILRDQKAARDAATAAIRACRLEQWDEALAAAREAVSLDPNLGRAWLALGHAARRLDRDAVAATALRNALRRRENPPWTAGQLALALASIGRDDEAAELALRIEREWPDDMAALPGAAYALLNAGREADSRRILQRILELDPEDDWARRMLNRLDPRPDRM